jgi:hypothetical protein
MEKALSLMHNHGIMIRLDPDLVSYEECPPANDSANSKTKTYKITDAIHTLPRGLWDTTVAFVAEITDIENGVEWVIKAPLGLVQTSFWTVQPASEEDVEEKEGRLTIVEDVEIKCSRLLVGTVKAKCEENWKGLHSRWIEKLNSLE